jgi:hypothetical protein
MFVIGKASRRACWNIAVIQRAIPLLKTALTRNRSFHHVIP